MFRFVILVLALAASSYGASISERIVGGITAEDGAFPYTASLRSFNRHFCGASIINERWVVTAAHCITSVELSVMQVVVGTNTLNRGGDIYSAIKTVIHPDWSEFFTRNDIGLVQVDREIVWSDKVKPIPLPTEDFTKVDYPAVLAGWGSTQFPGGATNELLYGTTTIISQTACRRRSYKTTEANICSTTNEIAACYGDSGSPLVADGVLIGFVSWGTLCGATNAVDVNTRVWTFVDWINENVN